MLSRKTDGPCGAMRAATAIVLAASALLAGCATASAEHVRRRASYQTDLEAYVRCNFNAAHKVASQPGDIPALAVAARDRCGREEQILRLSVDAHYVSAFRAWDMFNRFKNGVVEMNTDWIGQYRARRLIKRATAPR